MFIVLSANTYTFFEELIIFYVVEEWIVDVSRKVMFRTSFTRLSSKVFNSVRGGALFEGSP
jgi:hypothetical protein